MKVVEEKYKKIDVLLNNAGVAAKGDAFDSDVANFTFGTVRMWDILEFLRHH